MVGIRIIATVMRRKIKDSLYMVKIKFFPICSEYIIFYVNNEYYNIY